MSIGLVLDLTRPHEFLGETGKADYVVQDGLIFCWSESNVHYEYAWFMYEPHGERVNRILRKQPFPREHFDKLPRDHFLKNTRCPRCGSPSAERHPAVQFEGEVQPCEHGWHNEHLVKADA